MFLYELIDAFDAAKLPYVVVGGYALALQGLVRATMDVDFVLSLKQSDYEKAEKVLGQLGLQSRLPIRAHEVIKMRKEYIENRNLLAWSFVDFKNPAKQVDILINHDLKEFKIIKVSIGGRKISVASLQDLLEMKMAAGRPQDLVDVQNIREKLNEKKS
jgi:hypothetical protein